jgi:hypothetical protein
VNKIKGLSSALVNKPITMGDTVEVVVPNTPKIPFPIFLTLVGYISL